ncbi:hypothetical protein DFP72DRAFT_882100 [Ephemerocybe angulata]|uniref:DNA 3'-5' helicase n=1 Tax=Ephemerocybe angulata TaxID=980116 RepID=A0A8H6MCT2_9AGAR|nr:hypothetical protein DFP72DRAFT_882100 [Tulosesus angulatus]
MDSDTSEEPDFTNLSLEDARKLKNEDVLNVYNRLIPSNLAPSTEFWNDYQERGKTIGRRCCILLWIASKKTIVPHTFQLEAAIAMMTGRDAIVDVGTGYGKTFCMILPALYHSGQILLVVSPLKRLQVVQVEVFERYGARCTYVNEDTPNDDVLWKVRAMCPLWLQTFNSASSEHRFWLLFCSHCATGATLEEERESGLPLGRDKPRPEIDGLDDADSASLDMERNMGLSNCTGVLDLKSSKDRGSGEGKAACELPGLSESQEVSSNGNEPCEKSGERGGCAGREMELDGPALGSGKLGVIGAGCGKDALGCIGTGELVPDVIDAFHLG